MILAEKSVIILLQNKLPKCNVMFFVKHPLCIISNILITRNYLIKKLKPTHVICYGGSTRTDSDMQNEKSDKNNHGKGQSE